MNWVLVYYLLSGDAVTVNVSGLAQCKAVARSAYDKVLEAEFRENQKAGQARTLRPRTAYCINDSGQVTALVCTSSAVQQNGTQYVVPNCNDLAAR